MEIIPVKEQDKNEIIEISKYSFEWGDYIDQVFDLWLKEGIFIKAVEENKILGFLHIRLYDKFAWFEGLRVSPEARRTGVGTELTKMAIHLSQRKINRLMIRESNKPSLSLSSKLSFYEIDRVYYREGEKMDFDDIIKKYGLKKLKIRLKDNFVNDWVYFDYFYYNDHIYGNDSGLKLIRTDPPFILSGSIDEESLSKNSGDECFIIFERTSP